MYICFPAAQKSEETQPSSESLDLLGMLLSGHPFLLLLSFSSLSLFSFFGDGA